MIELIVILIGLGLVILAAIVFLRSLGDRRTPFRSKLWQFLKNVWDAITNIG